MYGLTSTLSMASEALNAADGAIAITNNNITNVNTAGYSRQIVSLSASALNNSGSFGDNGVSFGGFSSVRDEILQISINQKSAGAASLNAQSTSWLQIESAFSGTASGLGASLSTFFNSLSGLSTAPNDPAARQTAYSSASQLVGAFHASASALSEARSNADATVSGTVAEINQLSSQIATLNGQLAQRQAEGGAVQDQRDELTTQLAQLVGVTSIRTEATPTLALSNGTPLVMGATAYSLQVSQGTDGQTHILNAGGQDLTSAIAGGSLGGALTVRDTSIPGLSVSLDQLASQFATATNTAQAQGYDATGSPGQPMFSLPASGLGSASGLALALASPAGIAASADGSPGSSGNLSKLLAVQTQPLPSGQTPSDTYAQFVQQIGISSAQVTSSLSAISASLSQLNKQRSTQSGVSIDEETTNLLRYQQAYSAAAQVISTVNNLFSIVLNMSR